MVKDFIQTFEGGTNGSNVTVGNSGGVGGDAFSTIILNSGTDVSSAGNAFFTYSSSQAVFGSMGAVFTSSGITNNTYAAWLIPTGHGKRAVIRIPLVITANPAATTILTRIDTQGGIFSQTKINTSGKFTISAGSPNADIVASTSTFTVTFGTRYWLEHAVTIGTTTSNGVVEYRLITNSRADGTGTDTVVASYTNSAQNMGTDTEFGGTASRFRINSPWAASNWTTLGGDTWRARVTSTLTDWLGPYTATVSDVGAVTVTGVTPTLATDATVVTADVGTPTFVGVDPTFSGSSTTTVTADVAVVSLGGVDTATTGSGVATATADPAVFTAAALTPTVGGSGAAAAVADPGSLTLAGIDTAASGSGTGSIPVPVGALSLLGVDPSVAGVGDAAVVADPASLPVAGQTAITTGTGGTTSPVDTAVFGLDGPTPTIVGAGTGLVSVDPGPFSFAGTEVFLDASVVVVADPAFFTFTGVDSGLAGNAAATFPVAPAVLSWEGAETEFRAGRVAIVEPGVFSLDGFVADVAGEGDASLLTEPGLLVLTGTELGAEGAGDVTVAVEPATLLWSPQSPGFVILKIEGGFVKVAVVGLRGFQHTTGIKNSGLRARTSDNGPTVEAVGQNLRVVAVRSESLTGETDAV